LAASAVRFVTQTLGKEGGAELSAWLYERSNRLTPELIADYLASRGIADGFRGALPVVQRLVAQDAEYGIRLGVSGTPSLFVNGVELPNVTYLRTAIVFEVERQHPRSTSNKQPAR
jgi:hypothetical protein